MARKKPSAWGVPPRRYLQNRQTSFLFETKKTAMAHDRKRARILEGVIADDDKKTKKLIASLRKAEAHPPNMASARYVRRRRLAINGHLNWLIDRTGDEISLATLIPSDWLVPADQLETVEPAKLLEQIRSVLNRAGVSSTSGWAFIVLDLEYVQHLDAYSFHVHAVADGEMTTLLDSLRTRPKFQRQVEGLAAVPVYAEPIRSGTEAKTVNYLIKTYHGKRLYLEKNGELVRTSKKVSMPPARQAEYLRWMSRWKIDDFVLSVHLYMGKKGLSVSQPREH